jgi:hypothetical protein
MGPQIAIDLFLQVSERLHIALFTHILWKSQKGAHSILLSAGKFTGFLGQHKPVHGV